MKSLSLLSVFITYFLVIYTVSATELDSTKTVVSASPVGSKDISVEKSGEVGSNETSTMAPTEVSKLDGEAPTADQDLGHELIDSSGKSSVPTSTKELDLESDPESNIYTTEVHNKDEVEEPIGQSDEVMTLEVTSFTKEDETPASVEVSLDEVSTASELSGDEVQTTDLSGDEVQTTDLSGDEVQTTDLSGDEVQTTDLSGDEVQITDLSGDEVQTTDLSGDEVQTAGLSSDEAPTVAELSSDEASATIELSSGVEQISDSAEKAGEKDQEETQESLVLHKYEVPLIFACETKKLICHNTSTSNAITIQGSRKGSALFASFDSSMIRNSGINSGDVVSATLILNKVGGTRTLPVRVDILNLESKSSRISKSTVLATYRIVLPKTQNSPVSVDVTSAIRELLENAKDREKFSILVSAYSNTRFGDILTFPTKDYPNGLALELSLTKLPEKLSSSLDSTESIREVQSLRERIFSGQNLYIAMGILATVSIIVIVLMMM
ncbi:transmembrane protein [Cryptosporidium hominis TU502]|uniref:transmembrane protein n=1 Tax=Cryptosporidium hominis (strain TU502) TaxID=353151 RepID=UPI0000452DB2|nr:transmembrane protein [Cryptosporidium hominis TU502]